MTKSDYSFEVSPLFPGEDQGLFGWAFEVANEVRELMRKFRAQKGIDRRIPQLNYREAVIYECVIPLLEERAKLIRELPSLELPEKLSALQEELRQEREFLKKVEAGGVTLIDICWHLGKHETRGTCSFCGRFSGGY